MGLTEDQLAFGESVKNDIVSSASEESGDKEVPFYKEWPSRAARGVIEGYLNFSSLAYVPDPDEPPEQYAEQRQNIRDFYEPSLPVNPNEEAGFIEKTIERGGKNVTLALLTGGGTLLQSLIAAMSGGVAGQGAEELGFGPIGQTIAEVLGMSAPDAAKWYMKPTFKASGAEQEKLAEFGRQMALTEEDLALTTGQRGVARDVAEKVSYKGGKTVEAFQKTKEHLGKVWQSLKGRPETQKTMNEVDSSKMINEMSKKMSKMSSEARNKLQTDFNDFLSTQMTGEDVIDLWQKINYHVSKGEAVLGTLKPEMLEGLATLSPELASDFNLTNLLYGNFAKQAQRMGPDIADKLMTVGEAGMVLNGVLTGNVGMLQKVLGAAVGRNVARNMVIDPKMQNIGSRLVSSINKGSSQGVIKTFNQLVNEVAKNDAEAARVLAQFDMEKYAEELIQGAKKDKD